MKDEEQEDDDDVLFNRKATTIGRKRTETKYVLTQEQERTEKNSYKLA